MPGVRRRLRDVTKKVSGVLAGPREEADVPPAVSSPEGADPTAPAGADLTTAEAAAAPDGGAAAAAPSGGAGAAADEDSAARVRAEGSATRVPSDGPAAAQPSEEDPTVIDVLPQTAPAAPETASTVGERVDGSVVDERCASAVELARAAAADVADTPVGDHLGVDAETEMASGHVVTHWFASTDPAYVGWRWAVSVARAEGSDEVTVDEVVLLPGADALLAPTWVPWSERVQPGDLGAGDLLPPPADDPRLVPAYADVEAEPLPFDLHRELGLGRPRVLSLEGRADAAERWYGGEAGPHTPLATAAPGRCGGCGFLVPLAGALGRVFGACANAMAPDDGRVVALTHGCGAHSETVVEQPESTYSGMAVELEELELVDADTAEAPAG